MAEEKRFEKSDQDFAEEFYRRGNGTLIASMHATPATCENFYELAAKLHRLHEPVIQAIDRGEKAQLSKEEIEEIWTLKISLYGEGQVRQYLEKVKEWQKEKSDHQE